MATVFWLIALKGWTFGNLELTIGVANVLMVTVAVVLGYAFSKALTRPIRQIAEAAELIARGDVSKTTRIKPPQDEVGDMVRSFESMNAHLQLLQMNASQIGAGDLVGDVQGDGELYVAFRSMLDNLRSLAGRMSESSEAVSEAAAEMFSSVREQEASATEQNAALEEIRRALEHLAQGAEGVLETAERVSGMAGRSLESSQRIADQTRLVSEHSDRIGEILTLIQEIADRSDLLAFNAALEGTKAGEVGRGFSLVAEEMRRLSEHVMDSVRDIRRLVADMRSASHASVLATEEGIKIARDTSASAAQISEAAGMQREGTEQAKASAEEVLRVVNQTLEAVSETSTSAESLLQLSQDLKLTMNHFKLPT
jgi:methyl-accepting chemotaxis protein